MTITSGGAMCRERTGAIRKDPRVIYKGKKNIPWSTSPLKMRKLMQGGPGSVCLQKPNLNSPPAVVWIANGLPGAMTSGRAVRFVQTLFRVTFPRTTQVKTVLSARLQLARLLLTALDYLTWPGMFGSGRPIGTDLTTTKALPCKRRLRAIRMDHPTVLTRQSLA